MPEQAEHTEMTAVIIGHYYASNFALLLVENRVSFRYEAPDPDTHLFHLERDEVPKEAEPYVLSWEVR